MKHTSGVAGGCSAEPAGYGIEYLGHLVFNELFGTQAEAQAEVDRRDEQYGKDGSRKVIPLYRTSGVKVCRYTDQPGGACWRQGKAVELCTCHDMTDEQVRETSIQRVNAGVEPPQAQSFDQWIAGEMDRGLSRLEVDQMRDAWNAALAAHGVRLDGEAQPLDMVLHCPNCGLQHVDEPDERTPGWQNPPHRSHLCHGCKTIWRPADVPTNGVRAVKTRGKADTWPHGVDTSRAPADPQRNEGGAKP